MSEQTLDPEPPDQNDPPEPPGDDIVVVVDERVGTPDAIIGQPTQLHITYQLWPGGSVPPGGILMTREDAEASGYTEAP
jgi:hypothetical protein